MNSCDLKLTLQEESSIRREARKDRDEKIASMLSRGITIARISREIGVSRDTVTAVKNKGKV